MTEQKSLTPFQQALLNVSLEQFADVPQEAELPDNFSPAFLHNMQRLVAKTQRAGWYYVNTALKRAVLVAILAALLATTALAIPAVRETIIGFFVRDQHVCYDVSFASGNDNAPETIETVMRPTYIPESFSLDFTSISKLGTAFCYKNSVSDRIIFFQEVAFFNGSSAIGFNAEGAKRSMLLVDDCPVTVITDEDTYSWFWTDDNYFYSMQLSSNIPQEEARKIFFSIQPDYTIAIEP